MPQYLIEVIKISAFFALVGYFSFGIIKRDIVFGLLHSSFNGFRFKGVSAVIVSAAMLAFLFFGFFTLEKTSYSIVQYVLSIIIGLGISYNLHKTIVDGFMVVSEINEKTSEKQLKGDFIFWIVFGTMLSLLIAFFGFMISRSILITIATFLVPFSIVSLFGYAFSKFNSGR